MNKLFTELENENALRTYPFASGCTTADTEGEVIGIGIFIDAALYPVNPVGDIYLSRISSDGTVSISDEKNVIMTSVLSPNGTSLEFYDTSTLRRHVGTLLASSSEALASFVNVTEDRIFRLNSTKFAASCVFPIVNDGVTGISIGDFPLKDGKITFSNKNYDQIRVSTSSNGKKLRFDVIPSSSSLLLSSIQHIFCVVDGKTPFRIQKIPFGIPGSDIGNTVAVYLDNIERGDICSNAHRENALEMADTCKDCDSGDSDCHQDPEPPVELPYVYQTAVVDIPNGADSAFYLTVPNMTGYDNPLSLTLEDGLVTPKVDVSVDADKDNTGELLDGITSKGVVLQIPGLAASI